MCVCFCLSKPFPTSLSLPLQPLSREVEARCTQTHPDAFNLSRWVTSVHMFRFLAWTKWLAFCFGEKLGYSHTQGHLKGLPRVPASLLVASVWVFVGPPWTLTTTEPCGCFQQHKLPWGRGCSSLSCKTRDVVQMGREAIGQGGNLSLGTDGDICSPWLGLDYTPL